jgi:hypothetical protein
MLTSAGDNYQPLSASQVAYHRIPTYGSTVDCSVNILLPLPTFKASITYHYPSPSQHPQPLKPLLAEELLNAAVPL